jgi:uncharacterized protein YndB with AHSA1/START domain
MAVGKTADAGWEIGVSRTVPAPIDVVWEALTSADGVAVWLGPGVALPTEKGSAYETDDGTVGEVRSFHPLDRIRLTWQPEDWSHDSIVQVALSDKGERTGITFHQERLASNAERERQRVHWQRVMDALVAQLPR